MSNEFRPSCGCRPGGYSESVDFDNCDFDQAMQSISKFKDQLIERLAEINEKDNRIAVLDHLLKEVSDNLDASEKELREAQETVKRLQQSGVGA